MTPEQKAARRAIKGVTPDTDIAGIAFTEEQKATIRETEARWAKQDAAEQLAARWLADVPRYGIDYHFLELEQDDDGEWLLEADAIAHLARHLAPGDDLVERLTEGADIADKEGFPEQEAILRGAIARIAALTATVAEVTSDRAYIIGANAGWEAAVEQGQATPAAQAVLARINEAEDRIAAVANAAEADNATLRARLARMEGALPIPARLVPELITWAKDEQQHWPDDTAYQHDLAAFLAALTDGGSNG